MKNKKGKESVYPRWINLCKKHNYKSFGQENKPCPTCSKNKPIKICPTCKRPI